MLMPNLTSQVWNPRTTYMCGKFGANRDNFFLNVDLWPSMTLTLTKFDLTEMNPSRAFNSRVGLQTLTKFCEIGPKDVGEKQMWPLGPNDLDLCRNKPLMGNSGVGLHTRTNPVKCVPEAPHNPIYPVNCVARSDAPHKLTQCVARGAIAVCPT
jgi:hypothetical protein